MANLAKAGKLGADPANPKLSMTETHPYKLDQLDLTILRLLQTHGRLSNLELASKESAFLEGGFDLPLEGAIPKTTSSATTIEPHVPDLVYLDGAHIV